MRRLLHILVCAAALAGCQREKPSTDNPPAPGFNLAQSDPAAVELADSIMAAMGGRAAWDDTRYIAWNFFGQRDLVWDKHTGNVRIASPPDSTLYLVNVHTLEGRVQVNGREINDKDSLKTLLERARSIWINDSYWLVMPFKLKDSGVTLKYRGEDLLPSGARANVLELTFSDVGDTPENKYRVYADVRDNLIRQWAFYRDAAQDTPTWVRPWDNYQRYGAILLSADRSDNSGPRNVRVEEKLPQSVFTEF